MKRILACLLVAVMVFTCSAVFASANEVNAPFEYLDADGNIDPTIGEQGGLVPKVDTAITIDGQADPIYANGLKLNITIGHGSIEDYPVSGQAYLLYDDNYLYAFINCNDPNAFFISQYVNICDVCGKQKAKGSKCPEMAAEGYEGDTLEGRQINIWDDDCIEFMVDWTNSGSQPQQYRVSRSGYMSRDWDTMNTGFSGKGFDNGSSWGAEYAIPLDSSVKGTELGLNIMIHSQNSHGKSYNESYAFVNNSSMYYGGDCWASQYYDYIILGDAVNKEIDTGVTLTFGGPTTGTTAPTTTAIVVITGSGGETMTSILTESTTAGNNDIAPPTADPIVLIVVAAVLSLGAAVVVKKTCFSK